MMNRQFDPEVINGFIAEANGYLPDILQGIEDYLSSRQNVEQLEAAYRYTHTIKGAASMLGFMSLSEVACQLEEILLDLGEGQLTVSKETALRLRQVAIVLANHLDDVSASVMDGNYFAKLVVAPESEAAPIGQSLKGESDTEVIRENSEPAFQLEDKDDLLSLSTELYSTELYSSDNYRETSFSSDNPLDFLDSLTDPQGFAEVPVENSFSDLPGLLPESIDQPDATAVKEIGLTAITDGVELPESASIIDFPELPAANVADDLPAFSFSSQVSSALPEPDFSTSRLPEIPTLGLHSENEITISSAEPGEKGLALFSEDVEEKGLALFTDNAEEKGLAQFAGFPDLPAYEAETPWIPSNPMELTSPELTDSLPVPEAGSFADLLPEPELSADPVSLPAPSIPSIEQLLEDIPALPYATEAEVFSIAQHDSSDELMDIPLPPVPEMEAFSEADVRQAGLSDSVSFEATDSFNTVVAEMREPESGYESFFGADVSAELLEVFALEAEDHLRNMSQMLEAIKHAPGDRDALQEIRRSAHSLKGAAAMVGFSEITRLAHRMEDLLDQLYENGQEISEDLQQLLFLSTDALEDLSNRKIAADKLEPIYRRYDEIFGASQPPPSVHSPLFAESAIEDVPSLAEAETKTSVVSEEPDSQLDWAETEEVAEAQKPRTATAASRVSQQYLRIPIERLDELIKLAGELTITRTVFEQRMSDFSGQIQELRSSSERLRRVSSQIETQYEAAALAGGSDAFAITASDGGANAAPASNSLVTHQTYGFDALEFDRYTEFHLLSRELAETTNDTQTVGQELSGLSSDFDGYLNRQNRLFSEMQDKLMRLRMVPMATLATKLHRTVRHVMTKQNKRVDLILSGEETEFDKTMLEEMADPLLHILRNAVDHGIESPQARVAQGKPEKGTIKISAYHEGTQAVIRINDDGGGLDAERLVASAIRNGFFTAVDIEKMSQQDIWSLIFLPGFSTKSEISEISGRGVGMDVVRTTVDKLKGSISLDSTPGQGTTFTIRLPLTLAVTRVVMVKLGKQSYAIPLVNIAQILRVEQDQVFQVGQSPVINFGGEYYTLTWLSKMLNLRKASEDLSRRPPALLLSIEGRKFALVVDEIVGGREVLVKNLGNHIRYVKGLIGTTLLGDGSVVLILNVADLVRNTLGMTIRESHRATMRQTALKQVSASETTFAGAAQQPDESTATPVQVVPPVSIPSPASLKTTMFERKRGDATTSPLTEASTSPLPPALEAEPTLVTGEVVTPRRAAAATETLTVMIVDDSPSVRRVSSNLIRNVGWESVQARDGIEALEHLNNAAAAPDLILLDIEMPRMDGYQLLSTLRAQPAWRELPVVMVTSRSSVKHRQKAIELGATDYLVKPYQDDQLISLIRRLTGEAKAMGARG